MRIQVSNSTRLGELIDFLERTECVAVPAGPDLADLKVPRAPSAEQARRELQVYLTTWQAMHPGVTVELVD